MSNTSAPSKSKDSKIQRMQTISKYINTKCIYTSIPCDITTCSVAKCDRITELTGKSIIDRYENRSLPIPPDTKIKGEFRVKTQKSFKISR